MIFNALWCVVYPSLERTLNLFSIITDKHFVYLQCQCRYIEEIELGIIVSFAKMHTINGLHVGSVNKIV